MTPDIQAAIAKIRVGTSRGTGVLVRDRAGRRDLVLTALHVVADADFKSAIHLEFPGHITTATIERFDPTNDWALLRCTAPHSAQPLSLYDLRESGVPFKGYGFADAQPLDGLTVDGHVVDHQAALMGTPAIQLYCRQAAAADGMRVHGLSGGPCIYEGAVIGILRASLMREENGPSVAGTLYACPTASIFGAATDILVPPVLGAAIVAYLAAIRSMIHPSLNSIVRFGSRRHDELYVPLRLKHPSQARSTSVPEALSAAFSGRGGALFTGPPGTGKSTLLQHIASRSWHDPHSLGLPHPMLPLLLQSRHLIELGGSLELRLRKASQASGRLFFELPEGFLGWAVDSRTEWLLLLDAFDEVPSAHQPEVANLCSEILKAGHKLVLTTRPNSGVPTELVARLHPASLQPLDPEGQRTLAHRWLGERSVAFLEELEHHGSYLAVGQPLIFTLAALLYEANSLPTSTVALHRSLMDRLLCQDFNLPDLTDQALTHEVLVPLLEGVAHKMTFDASEADLGQIAAAHEGLLASRLPAESAFQRTQRVRALLSGAATRSGLLFLSRTGVEWAHPSFREFLAASALSKLPAVRRCPWDIVGRWQDPSRRTVILFMLALWSEQPQYCALAQRLLQRLANESFAGLRFAVEAVAVGCAVSGATTDLWATRLSTIVVQQCRRPLSIRMMESLGDLDFEGQGAAPTLGLLLAHGLGASPARKLFVQLVSLARDPSAKWPRGIHELTELSRIEELSALAEDVTLSIKTRRSAEFGIIKIGAVDADVPHLLALCRRGGSATDAVYRSLRDSRELSVLLALVEQGEAGIGRVVANKLIAEGVEGDLVPALPLLLSRCSPRVASGLMWRLHEDTLRALLLDETSVPAVTVRVAERLLNTGNCKGLAVQALQRVATLGGAEAIRAARLLLKDT